MTPTDIATLRAELSGEIAAAVRNELMNNLRSARSNCYDPGAVEALSELLACFEVDAKDAELRRGPVGVGRCGKCGWPNGERGHSADPGTHCPGCGEPLQSAAHPAGGDSAFKLVANSDEKINFAAKPSAAHPVGAVAKPKRTRQEIVDEFNAGMLRSAEKVQELAQFDEAEARERKAPPTANLADRAREAAVAIAASAVAWARDTGDCHFCGLWQTYRKHDTDCPVGRYIAAGEPPATPAQPTPPQDGAPGMPKRSSESRQWRGDQAEIARRAESFDAALDAAEHWKVRAEGLPGVLMGDRAAALGEVEHLRSMIAQRDAELGRLRSERHDFELKYEESMARAEAAEASLSLHRSDTLGSLRGELEKTEKKLVAAEAKLDIAELEAKLAAHAQPDVARLVAAGDALADLIDKSGVVQLGAQTLVARWQTAKSAVALGGVGTAKTAALGLRGEAFATVKAWQEGGFEWGPLYSLMVAACERAEVLDLADLAPLFRALRSGSHAAIFGTGPGTADEGEWGRLLARPEWRGAVEEVTR